MTKIGRKWENVPQIRLSLGILLQLKEGNPTKCPALHCRKYNRFHSRNCYVPVVFPEGGWFVEMTLSNTGRDMYYLCNDFRMFVYYSKIKKKQKSFLHNLPVTTSMQILRNDGS